MFNEASIGLRPRMFNFELEDNPRLPLANKVLLNAPFIIRVGICSGQKGSLFKCLVVLALEH